MRSAPPYRVRVIACAALIALLPDVAATAAGVGQTGRRTTDRQADLIAALLDRQMGDVADAICARHLAAADAASDAAARWAIQQSSVRTATMMGNEELTAAVIDQATQPPANLLASYPNHQRQLWLRTQMALVDLAAAEHAAVRLAAAGSGQSVRDAALTLVADALRQLDAIEAEVSAAIPVAETDADAPAALADDLVALRQTLAREKVDALLLRSRLYAAASADAVASATDAETAADVLLAQLPHDATIRSEVVRLKAEAILRAGDAPRAAAVLQALRTDGGWPSAEIAALAVHIALAQDDRTAAETIVQAFYGASENAASAPASMEMDLARLALLLHQAQSLAEEARETVMGDVADWLEAIEQRGGAYARRRGEAETLAAVRIRPGVGDVRLLAAQAADQLRKGQTRRAAEMLSQAATIAERADESLRYASQAAAALTAAGQPQQAAEILIQVSLRHADHPAAAASHLQAAWLLADALQKGQPVELDALQRVLVETMQRWPGSQQHRLAQQWVVRVLESSGRFREAARLAGPPDVAGWTEESIATAGRLWRRAALAADDQQGAAADKQGAAAEAESATATTSQTAAAAVVDEALAVLREALAAPDPAGAAAAEQLVWTAAVAAVPDRLRADRWPVDRIAATSPAQLYVALLEFRRDGLRPDTVPWKLLEQTSITDAADMAQRLMDDGIADPRDRNRIGRALLRLIDQLSPSDVDVAVGDAAHARALCWTGQWQSARTLLQQAIDAAPDDAAPLQAAATVLAECSATEARREAITLWNRVAAGLPQGSLPWHQAKLAAAELFIALGERDQAQTIARYVLLTQPPDDAALRARYEALTQ